MTTEPGWLVVETATNFQLSSGRSQLTPSASLRYRSSRNVIGTDVGVAVAVGCEAGVAVGRGVGVAVGWSVGVAVGSVVGIAVGSGVAVGAGVARLQLKRLNVTRVNKASR